MVYFKVDCHKNTYYIPAEDQFQFSELLKCLDIGSLVGIARITKEEYERKCKVDSD